MLPCLLLQAFSSKVSRPINFHDGNTDCAFVCVSAQSAGVAHDSSSAHS
jgi:hypothetical protein